MLKSKFIILKIKSLFIPFCICFFIVFLLLFSNNNLIYAKNGLKIWANSVVPSLLPFFIATELLGYTNIVTFLGNLLNKFMKPIFNVPGEGIFALIMGIISGYPLGAKIVSNLKLQGKLTSTEAERLIAFTNNSGPLFIIGTVGIGLFKNTQIGILLFITHILAGLSVGFVFRWWKFKKKNKYVENTKKKARPIFSPELVSLSNLGEILSKSIMSAINTILVIGGFIVLFSVIITCLENSHIINILSNFLLPILNFFKIPTCFCSGIVSGIIELTSGINSASLVHLKAISQNIIIASFLLGFGGICVLLQVSSIISKVHLSIKPYVIGKVLHGIFAALYTYLFLNISLFFNLNIG